MSFLEKLLRKPILPQRSRHGVLPGGLLQQGSQVLPEHTRHLLPGEGVGGVRKLIGDPVQVVDGSHSGHGGVHHVRLHHRQTGLRLHVILVPDGHCAGVRVDLIGLLPLSQRQALEQGDGVAVVPHVRTPIGQTGGDVVGDGVVLMEGVLSGQLGGQDDKLQDAKEHRRHRQQR